MRRHSSTHKASNPRPNTLSNELAKRSGMSNTGAINAITGKERLPLGRSESWAEKGRKS